MSVRGLMAASDFPTFLQSSILNSRAAYNRRPPPQHSLKQPHPQHVRAVVTMQPEYNGVAFSSYGRIGPNPLSVASAPFIDDSSLTPGAPGQERFSENFLHLPDGESLLGGGEGVTYWPETSSSYPVKLRPAECLNGSLNDSMNRSFEASSIADGANDETVGKVENVEFIPPPAVISHQINAARYENIDSETWAFSSVEHDATSPASFDSQCIGPHTPTSPTPDKDLFHSFSGSSTSSEPTGKIECLKYSHPHSAHAQGICTLSVSGNCQCVAPTGSFNESAPLSNVWSATQIQPGGHFTFNNHSHAHGPPYQNHFMGGLVVPYPSNPVTAGFLRGSVQSEMETSPEPTSSDEESEPDLIENTKTYTVASHRRDRDEYLLKMREKGYSYKEIKRLGRFREAESTLRGRIRVLTKDKSARVRKPEWTADDTAVGREENTMGRERDGRIPWKRISEWMHQAGSSYLFAPATCAKKWREIH